MPSTPSTSRDLENALINATYDARKAWQALSPAARATHAANVEAVASRSARAKRIRQIVSALDPGLAVLEPGSATKKGAVPADLQARLDMSGTAREEFARLSKKDQAARIAWVDEAKSEEGRAGRLTKTIHGLIHASDARRKLASGKSKKGPLPGW